MCFLQSSVETHSGFALVDMKHLYLRPGGSVPGVEQWCRRWLKYRSPADMLPQPNGEEWRHRGITHSPVKGLAGLIKGDLNCPCGFHVEGFNLIGCPTNWSMIFCFEVGIKVVCVPIRLVAEYQTGWKIASLKDKGWHLTDLPCGLLTWWNEVTERKRVDVENCAANISYRLAKKQRHIWVFYM